MDDIIINTKLPKFYFVPEEIEFLSPIDGIDVLSASTIFHTTNDYTINFSGNTITDSYNPPSNNIEDYFRY